MVANALSRDTYHYYLHGWNNSDSQALASLVLLIADKLPLLGKRVLHPEQAAIWLIDVGNADGLRFWRSANKHETASNAAGAGRFKVALSPDTFGEARWFIKKNPLRLNGDAGVLTVLAQVLSPPAAEQVHPLDALLTQIANRQSVELLFPEQVFVLIDAQQGQCWSNRHPRQWMRFFPQLVAIQPVSTEVFESLAMKNNPTCQAYPIDSIKWCSALFLWKGEASPQAARQQSYQLKNWPNFTHLPYHPKHMSLTNLLLRHPRTVDDLMEDVELSREFVQNFINACMAIDLLHINPSATKNNKSNQRGGSNPLKALLSRLGVST